jgi:hypothetical protein
VVSYNTGCRLVVICLPNRGNSMLTGMMVVVVAHRRRTATPPIVVHRRRETAVTRTTVMRAGVITMDRLSLRFVPEVVVGISALAARTRSVYEITYLPIWIRMCRP